MIWVRRTPKDIEALAKLKIDSETLEDDGFDWLEKRVTKPWGHEIQRYRDKDCSVCWLHLHSWQETSMHCHIDKSTMMFIVAGAGVVETLDQEHKVGPGDLVIVERGAFHRTKSGSGALVLYEVETSRNRNDLIRLDDKYGREGMGYERV